MEKFLITYTCDHARKSNIPSITNRLFDDEKTALDITRREFCQCRDYLSIHTNITTRESDLLNLGHEALFTVTTLTMRHTWKITKMII